MDEPFSGFYPTSSSSLRQHFSIRLLWLPLQCCIKMVSGSQSFSSQWSSARSTVTYGTATTFYEEEEMNGFELRLRHYFAEHNRVSVEDSGNQYRIQYFVGSQLSASQWQNIDSFRSTRAVVVVLNCTMLPCQLSDAIHYVQSVFDANFGDNTCRCIILNPPQDSTLNTSSANFIVVHSEEPIEVIGQRVLQDISRGVCSALEKIVRIPSTQDAYTLMTLRTPLDKGAASSLSSQIISSRHLKLKGDVLLQLGRVNEALEAYSGTYFSSKIDPLWRSATLEAIAAARYLKLKHFFSVVNDSLQTLVDFQSEALPFDANMLSTLTTLEKCMQETLEEHISDVRRLKKTAPYPLYHYIRHELSANMTSALSSFSKALVAIQESGTLDLQRGTLSKKIRDVVKKYVTHIHSGIDAFFKESLTQLKRTSELFHVALSDRELDTHLKWASFFAVSSRKGEFFGELNVMWRMALSTQREELIRRVTMYGVMLCAHCGCGKSAISLLMRIAVWERERQCHHLAVESIVYACTLGGLCLPYASEFIKVPDVLLKIAPHLHSSSLDGKAESKNVKTSSEDRADGALSPHSSFELFLLNELIQSMEQAGIRFGMLCRISMQVLFQYIPLLSAASQQKLMEYVEMDASHVPFLAVEETVFPLFLSFDPRPLPSHLAPKTIAICGPLFTYIDTQRLQLTVLCLNGKRLDSKVIWVVGEVGTADIRLTNPFKHKIIVSSISLLCSTGVKQDPDTPRSSSLSDPICYAMQEVELEPGEKKTVSLGVMPKMEGVIRIEGIECQLHFMGCTVVRVKFPSMVEVPVLQQLPQLNCSISSSRVKVFPGQEVAFSLAISNGGYVAVDGISISVHSEACQLEDCKGCCEIENKKELFITLDKTPLEQRTPIGVSESFTIPGVLHAPSPVHSSQTYFPLIRLDYWLKYGEVSAPPNIPSAIPVFGVVPRRVREIRWPVTVEAGIDVKGLELSLNRRSCCIRLVNRNEKHSICVFFSAISFFGFGDAIISASSEYATPFVEIAKMKKHSDIWRCIPVHWSEPSSRASGKLLLDFSALEWLSESNQILYQCHLSAFILRGEDNESTKTCIWSSEDACRVALPGTAPMYRPSSNDLKNHSEIISIPLAKVVIVLTAEAPWKFRKKFWLSVALSVDEDMGSLSGPIDSCAVLGNGKIFTATFEYVPYVAGDVVFTISLRDDTGDVAIHRIFFHVSLTSSIV